MRLALASGKLGRVQTRRAASLGWVLFAASAQAWARAQSLDAASEDRPLGFRALLWRNEASIDDDTRAVGGMCVPRARAELEEELEAAGLDYLVFNAAGRDELHLERERESWSANWTQWKRDRDPALLRREPCLAQTATRERLRSTLAATLGAREGPRGLGLSLGDEVGLTPGGAPFDVCQCEACEREFARWPGRATRAWLTVDGVALRLCDITTDGACRALADGDTGALGPWLARRDFHQDQLVDLLAELARQSRAAAPEVPLGLLGISGRTAFAGVAPELVLPWLDFLECYRVGDARELLFSQRSSSQSAWITLFRDQRGPHASAWFAWEHWLRGGDGVVVWSDRELRAEPALAERLRRALAQIDALDRASPDFRPSPRGVALINSPHSLAAAWLREAVVDGASWPNRLPSWQERHGLYEGARRAWLSLLDDCGAQAGSVPSSAIDARTRERFGLLIASNWLVVDAAELAGIEAHLSAGGALLLSGEFGWIDSAGRRLDSRLREQLALRFPGRVLEAERGLANYSSRPFDAQRVESTRAQLAALGIEFAPWRRVERSRAWIETWSASGTGFVGALLPALDESSTPHWPERLELRVDSRFTVEWLHPDPRTHEASERVDGAERCAALAPEPGDAVVLRLRR